MFIIVHINLFIYFMLTTPQKSSPASHALNILHKLVVRINRLPFKGFNFNSI